MTSTENNAIEQIARLMRAVRKSHKITQVEMAERLGVTQATVSKIESGLSMPSLYTWLRFCRAMELNCELPLIQTSMDQKIREAESELAKLMSARRMRKRKI